MSSDLTPQPRPRIRLGQFLSNSNTLLENLQDQQRQDLLSLILKLLVGAAVPVSLLVLLFFGEGDFWREPVIQTMGATLIVFFVAFLLNRAGYFDVAATITLLVIPLDLIILSLAEPADAAGTFIYFIIPIFLCSILYSTQRTLIFSVLSVVAIFVVEAINTQISFEDGFFAAMFVVVGATFILFLSYLRQKLLVEWQQAVASQQGQLSQQNSYLEALHETSLALMSRQKLEDLLQVILARAAELAGTAHGNIYLLSADGHLMEPRVTLGVYSQTSGGVLYKGQGFVGKIWETGEPLVIADYDTWAGRLPAFEKNVVHASIGVPLKSENRVLGTISLSYVELGREFTAEQMDLLGRFAQLASIALDSTQLYTAVQQELTERQHNEARLRQQNEYLSALHETAIALTSRLRLKELLQTILERAARLVEADHGSIDVLDPSDGRMRLGAAIGALRDVTLGQEVMRGVGLSGQVWDSGEVRVIDDYAAWAGRISLIPNELLHASVAVPLKIGNLVTGILNLGYQDPVGRFTDADIEYLKHFAELASIALDNAYLYGALQQELTERLRVEESLKNSEAYFRALIENTSDVITLIDDAGNIRYESPSIQRILGYVPEKLIGDSIFAYIHPDDIERVKRGFLRGVDRPGIMAITAVIYRCRHQDGSWRIMEATASNLLDNPAVKAVIATSRDITDRRKADEELRASEERFRQLTENIREVFWMTTADYGQVLYLSAAFEAIWGRGRGDVYAYSSAHLKDVLPEYQSKLRRVMLQARRGESTDIEFQIQRPADRQVRWIWSRSFPVQDAEGNFYRIAGVLEDITERKATEEALVTLLRSERDQRVFAEALRDSALAISGSLNQHDLLNQILSYLGQVVPHDGASILLFESATGMGYVVGDLTHKAEFGFNNYAYTVGLPVMKMPVLRGMVETHQPKVIADVHQDPNWVAYENEEWIRSWVGAPILRADMVIGFINLNSSVVAFFTEEHRDRLLAFAGQVGVALENARIFELEQEQRIFAEALHDTAAAINSALTLDEVLAQVLAHVDRVSPYDAANIMLLDSDKKIARVAKARGYLERGLEQFVSEMGLDVTQTPNLRKMMATHQPLAIPVVKESEDWTQFRESEWIESHVSAPIMREQEVIGFLNLDSTKRYFFNLMDGERLQVFANQIGVAIENGRLFDLERDQRIFAEALRDTASAVSSTLDLHAVLREILSYVERVVPHDAANIMLINPDNQTVSIVGAYGYSETELGSYVLKSRLRYVDVAHLSQMSETSQPLIVPNVTELESWFETPGLTWVASYASAPIRHDGRVIGFLNLDSAIPGFFKIEYADRLLAFADQAAIAIHNARLYESERQQRELAETLRDIGIVLTGTLHEADILPKILEQVARVIPYEAAGVWMRREDEVGIWRLAVGVGYERFGVAEKSRTLSFTAENSDIVRQWLIKPEVIIVSQLPYDGNDFRMAGYEWLQSWASTPIVIRGELAGWISLEHTQSGFYNSQHIVALETLARQISIILENARWLAQAEKQAQIMEEYVGVRTRELQRERAQLQAILDAMGEGVIYSEYVGTAEKSQIQFVNNAFCRLTGYDSDALVNYSNSTIIEQLFAPEDLEKLYSTAFARFEGLRIEEDAQGRKIRRVQLPLQRKDGTTLDVALTSTSYGTQDSQQHWQLMLLRDVSQEKVLESQKARFVANASHELRTPLTNLRTRLYLLRKQPDMVETHAEVMERTTDRMVNLVEDLLNVSRFERGIIPFEPAETDLLHLIGEIVDDQQMEANRKSIHITSDLPTLPLHLMIDAKRIHQVITNVVVNAISYTPENGGIMVKVNPQEGGVLIQISDTGPGIQPEQLSHVFDPFFRASEGKVSGTGLGLTIARDIVERHEGKIWAESEFGQGSTFNIWLPLRPTEMPTETPVKFSSNGAES